MKKNVKLKEIELKAIFVISAVVLFTAVASAATIWVPEGGNQTIQQAVNNATGGDTIIVRDAYTGTKENVDLGVAHLTIKSENGSANCIVNASDSSDHVFNVTANYVNITGFTVQNTTYWWPYAGIYLKNAKHCNISNNNVNLNYYGIHLMNSSNNTITKNNATENGESGIMLASTSDYNNITNNNASDNEYHGIGLDLSCYNNLTSNIANTNYCDGIYLRDSCYNNLTSNIAKSNGYDGIVVTSSSNNNTLINNTAAGHRNLGGSFNVFILREGKGEQQGELSFYNYETRQLPLKHDAGNLTLRLAQQGHDGAYVDYVALKRDDTLYLPTSALNLDSTANIWHKIISPEYDVCDAWNSTLEIRWDNVPENTTLVMRAMEEDLGEGHGSPLFYPLLREGYALSHTLVADGGVIVDGLLEESGEPDFCVFWRPDTPHPDGYTYGWLHSDNQCLYAAVEIIADNTPDEEDWGALFVIVNGELQKFRVSCTEMKWGAIGFQYTSAVPYEHRIYEFKIPLSVINASIGDEVHYGFGAYGTVAAWYSGITLNWNSNNTLISNTLTDNDHGVYLSSSSNNRIYNNYFDNTNNAWDNGNNIWNITPVAGTNIIGGQNLGGNYWRDYAGVDNGEDGLGDTLLPYNSSGSITNGGDWHPLVHGSSIAVPDFSTTGLFAGIGMMCIMLAISVFRRRRR